MGQSLVQNYLHIVFSTKNRKPYINSSIDEKLYAYLSGTCNELESPCLSVGGYKDHVHLLCKLSKKLALTTFLSKIKSSSSKWIKTNGAEFSNFYWQDGYGAFSVNPTEVNLVIDYIKRQSEHHQKKTFQDEYRAFLKKYKVDYDEKYIWD
ncbi:MAG: IS200/IS605 family transposase [Cyclobacteriaceae bacterium]|nr:IS200/IS605 family transposase [Cyclobacteriaceae bacterium]MCH8514702.1 IS200/IS605 family transposase [Cyclobacteriaceae bacterium]